MNERIVRNRLHVSRVTREAQSESKVPFGLKQSRGGGEPYQGREDLRQSRGGGTSECLLVDQICLSAHMSQD